MTDHPYTREAIERWQQGKINIFDAMAELEDQRDEAMASSNERGVVVSQVSGALVDAGCAVGDAREFGSLVTKLSEQRDQWRECAERLAAVARARANFDGSQKPDALVEFERLKGLTDA